MASTGKSAAVRASASGNRSRKRRRGSGADAVYESLRRSILELGMEPGTLLDETELADQFGLSRSPVREALIRLSGEGLVQILRNRSSIVALFDVATIPSYLDATELMYRVTTRLAAQNRSAAQLATIQALYTEHTAATKRGDMARMIGLNQEFHLAIAKASGNSFFHGWMRQILDQGQRILGLYLHDVWEDLDPQLGATWTDNHEHIVRAIRARDPDAAEDAARRDAETISARMKERFASRPSGAMPIEPQLRRKR
jgi:DNA-binding GntR family transcriptional regulator